MTEAAWTIVTVTFNNARDMRELWEANDLAGVEWIVADNASTDDSVVLARRAGAHVLEIGSNVGFARANNAALRTVRTEFVAFVNPDVRVQTEDLDRLATTVRATGGIVAPQLLNADGSDQPNGRGLPFLVDKLANRGVRLPMQRLDRYVPTIGDGPTQVHWFMGAVVAGRREDFERLGGWDEQFFLYYEDHVMGLRAWEHGIPVAIEPRVRWMHGWRRETTSFRWSPWMREIASAIRFYRRYPWLLLPTRRLAEKRVHAWKASPGRKSG